MREWLGGGLAAGKGQPTSTPKPSFDLYTVNVESLKEKKILPEFHFLMCSCMHEDYPSIGKRDLLAVKVQRHTATVFVSGDGKIRQQDVLEDRLVLLVKKRVLNQLRLSRFFVPDTP